jgi:fructan beta-fructosidase
MSKTHAGWVFFVFAIVALAVRPLHARPDTPTDPSGLTDAIVIADFEGDDYHGWTATGTALGKAPARGTLPGQMSVEGFLGRGLVNTFLGGDDATGTLTSPPFKIERNAINLLVGGGKFPGETTVELLVDDRVVRSATGPNDQPGGSERLAWKSWNVADLRGKSATIRIVDKRGGSWGHINVDHIVQSDTSLEPKPARRETVATARYLHLPVKNGAPKRRMKFTVDGKIIREFEIELADGSPDFLVFSDLAAYRGQMLTIEADSPPASLAALAWADVPPDPAGLYREPLRPQFHFTSRRGWLNDPNGLVYHEGEYHLFYQHNPYGREWGNMHWGHAVSPDLVHWRELPIALYPYQFGDWAFSGSAIVDEGDLVAAYTSTGRGECIVRSTNRGRTWTEQLGNPVVKHNGRDPKLVWHEPTKQWIMAVYDEAEGRRSIAFHGSKDLKTWTYLSRIDDFFECPDLFALPVDGNPARTLWVLYAADGRYRLGQFDGKEFHPESGKQQLWHGNFYAAQTFSDMPDGRRVQIGWAQGTTFPGMPFNQQMTFATRLTLRSTSDGVHMYAEPVEELASLRKRTHTRPDQKLTKESSPLPGLSGDLFAIRLDLEPGKSGSAGLTVRGLPITYDAKSHKLSCGAISAPLEPINGRIRLQILVDRASVEVFGNDGRVALSVGYIPPAENKSLVLFAKEGEAHFRSLVIDELNSIWTR